VTAAGLGRMEPKPPNPYPLAVLHTLNGLPSLRVEGQGTHDALGDSSHTAVRRVPRGVTRSRAGSPIGRAQAYGSTLAGKANSRVRVSRRAARTPTSRGTLRAGRTRLGAHDVPVLLHRSERLAWVKPIAPFLGHVQRNAFPRGARTTRSTNLPGDIPGSRRWCAPPQWAGSYSSQGSSVPLQSPTVTMGGTNPPAFRLGFAAGGRRRALLLCSCFRYFSLSMRSALHLSLALLVRYRSPTT